MIKTLTNLFKQDKEKFVVPKGVQDVIPIAAIYDDGILQVGKDKFSKTFKFSDINYAVASREDKEAMFLEYSELLNSLDSAKGHCGLHTELICHKYNEINALARRNLSLCRCVFIFCGISIFYSVSCRSPPSSLNFLHFEI